jgi:hypothetical protein
VVRREVVAWWQETRGGRWMGLGLEWAWRGVCGVGARQLQCSPSVGLCCLAAGGCGYMALV